MYGMGTKSEESGDLVERLVGARLGSGSGRQQNSNMTSALPPSHLTNQLLHIGIIYFSISFHGYQFNGETHVLLLMIEIQTCICSLPMQ